MIRVGMEPGLRWRSWVDSWERQGDLPITGADGVLGLENLNLSDSL